MPVFGTPVLERDPVHGDRQELAMTGAGWPWDRAPRVRFLRDRE